MRKESEGIRAADTPPARTDRGSGAEVTWDDSLPDPDNPSQPRQIDVTIRRDGFLTLVECRLHKGRQDVKWIEELMGRRISLQAANVIAVSSSGFTEGANKKAAAYGVALRDLRDLTPKEVANWGCTIEMKIYYYEYEGLNLVVLFRESNIAGIDYQKLTEELKVYPADCRCSMPRWSSSSLSA
jgi:hypothetical protein